MYLIYVDESGKPTFNDPNDFVLSAVIIKETKWNIIDKKVNDLKQKHFPADNPKSFEFHFTDIKARRKFFEKLNIKTMKDLLLDIAMLISEIECTLISVIIRKRTLYPHLQYKKWVQDNAWKILAERLEKYLEKYNPSAKIEHHGLITMDREDLSSDNIIRRILRNFQKDGSEYLDSKHLIEDPFFVSSHNSNIVQLADFVAWVSRRKYYYDKTSSFEDFYDKLFAIIEPKFDTNTNGNMYGSGFKFYPRK